MTMMLDPVAVRSLLVQRTRSAWEMCLGRRPAPRPTVIRQLAACPLRSTTVFTGHWCGALHVLCTSRSALDWASAMFDIQIEECSDDDAIDAIGELANIVAGGLLDALPCGTVLQPPAVDWDPDMSDCGHSLVSAVEFGSRTDRFIIALVSQSPCQDEKMYRTDPPRTSTCDL